MCRNSSGFRLALWILDEILILKGEKQLFKVE